jgi:choline dehydrogenase
MYDAMKKMPRMDLPLDGANGNNGLFWFPSTLDPVRFRRSYSRTGHYDGKADKRDNYDVITRHRVLKVLIDEDKAATGVQFLARDGDSPKPRTVKARKEVILSAGTIHTPQILQLSGIGPKKLLEEAGIQVVEEIPGVGQNFQDHAYLSVGFSCKSTVPKDDRGKNY